MDADKYVNDGNVRYDQGDLQGALADFERALQLDANFVHAYLGRGNVRYDQGNLHGALGDYERALQLNPNLATAYYNKGLVLEAMKKSQAAQDSFRHAAKFGHADAKKKLKAT